MRKFSAAKVYVLVTLAAGYAVLGWGLLHWQSPDLTRFLCYLAVAALAAVLKIQLPGIAGTLSLQFVFLLICTATLSLPETVVIACVSTPLQWVVWSRGHTRPLTIAWSIAVAALAVAAAYVSYHGFAGAQAGSPLLLAAAACVFFFVSTSLGVLMTALAEAKDFGKLWRETHFWTFPHYLAGGGVAGLLTMADQRAGRDMMLLVLPALYWMYHSYRLYLERVEQERRRCKDLAALQLRTIEALSVAIEGKDPSKHGHPQRVRIYAVEAGRHLGLSEQELQALHSAALLRDIGTLAVPEHIFSKPGKLTAVEFEKVKIHSAAGAEILEQIDFPYPVAPVVRSHHEKWDGTGYPSGLKGNEIPIGARILSVADCLDALISDRHHRRAVSLEEAMEHIRSESGKSFDPRIVDVFAKQYHEMEGMVRRQRGEFTASQVALLAHHREDSADSQPAGSPIAAAREEVRQLLDLAQVLGSSLSLDETLSSVALRVRRMLPYDSIAVYIRRQDYLEAEYASGENSHYYKSLKIPIGQGISGWVAENRTPVLNGDPVLEDPDKASRPRPLHSALAVPLEGLNGVVGVLAVYAREKDAFTNDHLRILSAVTTKVALSIENALKYRRAEDSATTDALTGLPNARALFLQLETELARASRQNQPLALLMCDLDRFKQINDEFGHLAGNRVLSAVGRALKLQCREYDYVARMGGDEFVIVLSGYHSETVAAKVEQFSHAAAEAGRDTLGVGWLGLSIGVACYPNDGETVESLMVEADRRMYSVKPLGDRASSVVPM